jgi:site-specific DNA-methyltransferase (adenine-specific)
MKLTTTKIAELSLDPSNVRKHSRRNLDAIKASLRKFGQQKPIVVDAKGIVLAGNGTLTAAQELGWTEIQIVRTELAGVEATAFAIADNRTAELAEWEDKLVDVIKSLIVAGVDGNDIGFNQMEIDDMMEADAIADEADEIIHEQSVQVEPSKEYLIILAENEAEWDEMIAYFDLKKVRRGGYAVGSAFDAVGIERVLPFKRIKK